MSVKIDTLTTGALAGSTATLAILAGHQYKTIRALQHLSPMTRLICDETGLALDPLFQRALESSTRLGIRYGHPFGIVIIGLERPAHSSDKDVREGTLLPLHATGANTTTARLRKLVRNSDFIARLSSNIFAALLYLANMDQVSFIRKRIENRLSHSYLYRGVWLDLSVTCAAAAYPETSENSRDLFNIAAKMMPTNLQNSIPRSCF